MSAVHAHVVSSLTELNALLDDVGTAGDAVISMTIVPGRWSWRHFRRLDSSILILCRSATCRVRATHA